MLEQNASVGEYYEQICSEFLESVPPETRAHLYSTTMCGTGISLPTGNLCLPGNGLQSASLRP